MDSGVAGRFSGRAAAAKVTTVAVIAVVLGGLALAGRGLAGQVVPQRVVVRGCCLTTVPEVLGAAGFSAGMSQAALRRGAASVSGGGHRWLRAVKVSQALPRTAVISVEERCPLLLVESHGAYYWLCDDNTLVRFDEQRDSGGVFNSIRQHPQVRLPYAEAGQQPPLASAVLMAAACCAAVLPETIKMIEVDGQGELNLYDRDGFRIRLGAPVCLEEKIGALPKALRLCQQDREKLEYLDARNPTVFYEKWAEPIS